MSEQNPVDQDCQEPDPPPFPMPTYLRASHLWPYWYLTISKCLYWNRTCSVPELALLEKGCHYRYRHWENTNTSIGIREMLVLVLARLAKINVTSTGIICMTILVLAMWRAPYQYWHCWNNDASTSMGIAKMPVLVLASLATKKQY